MPYPTVVLVDRDPSTIAALVLQLNRWGCAVVVREALEEVSHRFVEQVHPHLVIANYGSYSAQKDWGVFLDQVSAVTKGEGLPVLVLGFPEAEGAEYAAAQEFGPIHFYNGALDSCELLGRIFLYSRSPETEALLPGYYPAISLHLDERPIGNVLAALQQAAFSGCLVVENEQGQGVLILQAGNVQEAYWGGVDASQALAKIQGSVRGKVTLHQRALTERDLHMLLNQSEAAEVHSPAQDTPTNGTLSEKPLEQELFPDIHLNAEDIFLDSLYFLHGIFETYLGDLPTRHAFRDKINEYAALYGDHFPLRYNEISQEKIQLFASLPEASYPLVVQLFQELAGELYAQAGADAMDALVEKLQEIQPYLESFDLWSPLMQRLNEIRTTQSTPVNGKIA